MTHANERTLLALVDGALAPSERLALQGHIAQCTACSAELDRIRALSATFGDAMDLLDPPAPTQAAYAAVLRRRARGWGVESRRILARAAVLVVAVAGIASATIPGSPVREWLADQFGSEPISVPEPPQVPLAASPPAGEVPSAGIAILPAQGAVQVVLAGVNPGLRVRVRLEESDLVDVRATGAASDAQFRTGPGRISITGGGAGEVLVVLPRGLGRATVLVDGKPYLIKTGGQIRVLAPVADSAGAEIVFPVRP